MSSSKILFLLAGLLACAGLHSCSGDSDDGDTPKGTTLSCAPATLDFTHEGGTQSLTLETNADWAVKIAATAGGTTWCTLSASAGKAGRHTIQVSVTPNDGYDDRSVTLTIQAGSDKSKSIIVTQKQRDALILTSNKLEVGPEGGEVSFEVKANIAYEVIIDEACKEWLTAKAQTRGLQSRTHVFTVAPSEEHEQRNGNIYVKSGEKLETVQLFQAGSSILLLTPGETYVEAEGGTVTVELRTNCEYDVQLPAVNWIAPAPAVRSMSSHTLRYTVLPNESYDSREAEIRVFDKARPEHMETLRVVQAQKDAIIISRREVNASPAGETIEVELNSNVEYSATILPAGTEWITAAPATRGLTISRLRYVIAPNETGSAREARIVFANQTDSNVADTLVVRQSVPDPRTDFLARTEVCIIKGNALLFNYDKAAQQYYHAPARGIYRILTDDGSRHVTLTLSGTPTADTPVEGTIKTNWDIPIAPVLRQIRLIQENEELIWLWSDEEMTGFILPKVK